MEDMILAGVDIGGTKITVCLANSKGILAKAYQPVRLVGDTTTIPRQVDQLIEFVVGRTGVQKEEIAALGVASCGPFGTDGLHLVVVAPNLCGGLAARREVIPNDWTSIPLEAVLSDIYPHLVIDNDAIAATVAERLFGAARDEHDMVYVTWSTGIGSGAFVNGQLIKGKHGNAPHLGHIYLVEDGPQCGCGNFGDMESLVSGVAIGRDYGGTASDAFSAYQEGDPKAVEIIETAARLFAKGLASITAILDTRVIVIGGSVFINNTEILLPLVKQEFYRFFPALSKGVDIRPSELNTCLGDMAALSLVMPDDWIAQWQATRPWQDAPRQIVLDGTGKEIN